jgi:glycosyltransferase involved in cell wall biosynthesis
MENVMRAIELASHEKHPISWIFIGEGRKLDWMKNRVIELNLEKNVFFLGQHPVVLMPSYFQTADVMLISLKNEKIFSYTAPAKIQAYMASAKPILAMINGEGASIIEEAKCGLTGMAGDANSLVENALKFARMSTNEREEMGKNGFHYYQNYFSKDRAYKTLFELINE